jgi:hypothetical protein
MRKKRRANLRACRAAGRCSVAAIQNFDPPPMCSASYRALGRLSAEGARLMGAITAATFWWKASIKGVPDPGVSISDDPEMHIISTQVAFNESSRLNGIAAYWTGVAAILSATASVLGVL